MISDLLENLGDYLVYSTHSSSSKKLENKDITFIEKLILTPSEETTNLLYDDDSDESEIFWVDWRSDDSEISEMCESVIKTNKLSSDWVGEDLLIKYGDNSKSVPLTLSGADRHITLLTINEILSPDYEIRMVWDSNGSDTLAFAILSMEKWNDFETQYGVVLVNKAFLRLTKDLNTFTDSLHGHRNN